MGNTNNRFKTLGIVASILLVIAAFITFSGPNFLIYGSPGPFRGIGLWFSIFYVISIAASIGLILDRKWARYIFAIVVLLAFVRAAFVITILGKDFLKVQTGVATTNLRESGDRYFKLVVSANPESTCDRVALPVWSFTVDRDVLSMQVPISFDLTESGTPAHAFRFIDNSGPGIPVGRGKLTISKVNDDKSMTGWFSVFTEKGRSLSSFRATWCGEKNESDVLKKGEEDYNRRLKESGGTTNR